MYHARFVGANVSPYPVPTPTDAGDAPILAELARESERIIDLQVRAFERAEDKSDRLMGLGMVVLAGGLSLGAFASGGSLAWREAIALGLVAAGAGLNMAALVLFLRASPGLLEHHDVRLGPAPSALARRAGNETWVLADPYQVYIDAMAQCHIENLANLARAVLGRHRGLRLVLCAVGAYSLALFLIAGSSKVVL